MSGPISDDQKLEKFEWWRQKLNPSVTGKIAVASVFPEAVVPGATVDLASAAPRLDVEQGRSS